MSKPKLYDLEVSGNCYKVRLLCACLGVPLEIVPVDFMDGEHKMPPLLYINPFGELPVFDDDGLILRDSQAILVYVARKWGDQSWLPTDAAGMAKVVAWLSVAANEIARGPNDARLIKKFGYSRDYEAAKANSDRILTIMEAHLGDVEWLALGRPTIADIACMPYIGIGHEGDVGLDAYPNIRAWIERMKALPGYIPMPGL